METTLEILKKELSTGDTKNVEKALVNKAVKPEDRVGKDGFSLIHWACYYGIQNALQKLLLYNGSTAVVDKHGWTPAHICAIQGQNNCLKVLLKYGADIHSRDKRGYTSGHLASAHGNTFTLKTLLEAGYKLETKDSRRQWTAIHHAAFHGRFGVMQLLAKWDSNLMAIDEEGNTPAHFASSEGHIDCLRLLVYYNHTPLLVLNSRNDKGETPKDLSIKFQKQDCADFLSSAKSEAEIDESEDNADEGGLRAAYEGNIQLLSMLVLEGHCDVNQMDRGGSTLAHKAAGNGHIHCLQWLLDHGADVSLRNNINETPLDVAKKFGKLDCIALLGGGNGFDTEEDIDCSPLTLEKAKEQLEKFKIAFVTAKQHFRDLGGVIEEEREGEIKLREAEEHYSKMITTLESQLEMEREKREHIEKEMDELRAKLYQANENMLHYQSLSVSNSTQAINKTSSIATTTDKKFTKQMFKGNEKGGAYFNIKN